MSYIPIDPAHVAADKAIRDMEKKIKKEYKQAIEEVEDKLEDYLRRYALKDRKWRQWVHDGKKTEKQYKEWRLGQLAMGERWEQLRDALSDIYLNAYKVSYGMVNGYMPAIYADNYNYATYYIENGLNIDTSFVMYDYNTVYRMMAEDPDMLPPPGRKVSEQIRMKQAKQWDNQRIQSVMIQGILQGQGITELAMTLAYAVGDSDTKAAIRNARTMTTGAENAGRVAGYKRAQSMGIKLGQQWMATLDNRTRHSHRMIDGEIIQVGAMFSNGCRFPGDPSGPAAEVFNCRCCLVAALDGYALNISNTSIRNTDKLNQSYDDWKKEHSESHPITEQMEKGEAIRQSFIKEYRYL